MPSGTTKDLKYKGCVVTERIELNGTYSGVIIFPNKDKNFVCACTTTKAMNAEAKRVINDTLSCVEIAKKFLSMKLV